MRRLRKAHVLAAGEKVGRYYGEDETAFGEHD